MQPVDVRIEKLVYGGEGLGRVDGQVLLTPYVLPGETARVTPRRVKSGLLRAGNPEILESVSERVIPVCEYFGQCGGCQYQHAAYPFQLRQKEAILRETLERFAGFKYDREIRVIAREPWNYRNRVQLHFSEGESGFNRAGSHDVCGIRRCYISSPILVEAIAKIADAVKQPQWPRFLRSLELFTNGKELQLTVIDSNRPVAARFFEWCATFLPNMAPGAIEYAAAGFLFRISRGSFFQINRFLIDDLVREALGERQGGFAVDLYAGAGLFSLPLSGRFESVDAVERGGAAYRDLKWNTRQHNVRPMRASAEEYLRELEDAPDLVLADPPRAGLADAVTYELLRIRPHGLTVVSCDPATFSRDLKRLLEAYDVASISLLDLFPQAYHFETVVHLTRR